MAEEKCFIQKYIEAYGLEFSKDAKKFFEVMEKIDKENWTLGQFFEALVEAFSEKKDRILSILLFTEIDGEAFRVPGNS